MRGSIKRQISVIFIGLVVAILLISLGVNAKFLGQYYILNKQASLTEVYEKLKTASEKGTLTSDSTVEKYYACGRLWKREDSSFYCPK